MVRVKLQFDNDNVAQIIGIAESEIEKTTEELTDLTKKGIFQGYKFIIANEDNYDYILEIYTEI